MGESKKERDFFLEYLFDRAMNFHFDSKSILRYMFEDISFLFAYIDAKESIIFDVRDNPGLTGTEIIDMVFLKIYDFVVANNDTFRLFGNETLLHDDVFDACFFSSICMFIHSTKRLSGVSLRKFLYKYSTANYSLKGSTNYFEYDDYTKNASDLLTSEETKLRQTRYRLLSKRAVYNKRTEWSAIAADSEHEWSFYYVLSELNNDIQETYKRIGNLYNDINKERELSNYVVDEKRLDGAFDKFTRKVKKIKYEQVLDLHKIIISHIKSNMLYSGLNLYRFERMLRLYQITSITIPN